MDNSLIKNNKKETIGIITTYFSLQMLANDYNVILIGKYNYEDVIIRNGIKKLVIDNDIYESDHEWYKESKDELLKYLKYNNIKINVIKNSVKELENEFLKYEIIEIMREYDNVINRIPLLLNEKLFNPIEINKNNSVIFLHFNEMKNTPHCKLFKKNEEFSYEDVLLNGYHREEILYLIERVRNNHVLYINFDIQVDEIFLQYIINISVLLNVYVICDFKYNLKYKYAYNSNSDITNFAMMKIVLNNKIYKDKQMIENIRNIFLENTFFGGKSLNAGLISMNEKVRSPKVSIITSTNRAENLERHLKQLSEQNVVDLQVILNTHGYSLEEFEKKKIIKRYGLDIIFLESPEDYSLGKCLNLCIKYIKYPIAAKLDDDDYYCPNYLIDQCIALHYSNADVVGKLSQFIYIESENILIKRLSDEFYKYVDIVMGASIVCNTFLLKKYLFKELNKGEDADFLKRIKEDNGKFFANHPYDFCIFRGADKEQHTWKISDMAMLKSSKVICYGNSLDTLTT